MNADETPALANLRPRDRARTPVSTVRHVLTRIVDWTSRIMRVMLPSRIAVELHRIRNLPASTRRRYVRRLLLRSHTRAKVPRLNLESPATVLFVCYGNIMRSAIAAELFRAKLAATARENLVVRSAGTNARDGTPADPRMCDAASLVGISLASHRASRITEALVEEADVVFVMDYVNEAVLLDRVPMASDKVHLLGAIVPSRDAGAEIPDPYTADAHAARQCALRIQACVEALVTRSNGKP